MLTYTFDSARDVTLYEQLYRYIRDDIRSGELKGGIRLPSKRALSKQLGISTVTVENAYSQLVAEGYISSRPRQGYFVETLGTALVSGKRSASGPERRSGRTAAGKAPEPVQPAADPCSPSAGFGGAGKYYTADFSSNQTEPGSFPFSIWARLSREMLRDRQKEMMQNPPAAGAWELRESIAGHLRSWRGIQVSAEQIIVGAGTDFLYGLLIQLLGFDKIYALEDPGYRKLSQVYHAYGVAYRLIGVDRNGLDTGKLMDTDAQVIHVTPSHHFPTGVTMPAPRRYELLRWASAGAERFILEDDYDSEFRMNGKPLPALISMDSGGKVIYMNTFTKTLASTIRVSYMVLPRKLAERFERELSFYACSVPVLEQYTLSAFIRRGYFEKHLNRMRTANRKKRDLLLRLLRESRLGDSLTVMEHNAGLHFLLRLPASVPGKVFLEKLRSRGVQMLPLSSFFCGDVKEEASWLSDGDEKAGQTFLVNYSSLSEEQLRESVKVMETCMLEVELG